MLGSMLGSFQSLYPTGSLLTELVQIYQGKYIVKASLQIEGVTRVTGMAAAEVLETAEDRAQERAIALFGGVDNATQPQSIAAATEAVQPRISKPDLTVAISVAASTTPELATPVEQQAESTSSKLDVAASTSSVVEPAVAAVTAVQPTLLKTNVATSSDISETVVPSAVAPVSEPIQPKLLKSDAAANTSSVPETVVAPVTEPVQPTLLKPDVVVTNDSYVQATPRMSITPEISQVPPVTNKPEPMDEPLFDPALEDVVTSVRSELPLTAVPAPSNVTPFTPRNYNPPAEIELPPVSTATTTSKRTKKTTQPKDNSDDIAKIAVEMERLRWTIEQGRDYLFQTYRKKSRHSLTDDELRDFREYLESQPTPTDDPLAIDPIAGF